MPKNTNKVKHAIVNIDKALDRLRGLDLTIEDRHILTSALHGYIEEFHALTVEEQLALLRQEAP